MSQVSVSAKRELQITLTSAFFSKGDQLFDIRSFPFQFDVDNWDIKVFADILKHLN
jgi:hypothetical protein